MSWQSEENLVVDVNRVVRGWLNYFNYGTRWNAYKKLERFLQARISRLARSQTPGGWSWGVPIPRHLHL